MTEALLTLLFFAVVSFESFVDDPLTSLTGGSMEGKEDRFGIVWSALFGTTWRFPVSNAAKAEAQTRWGAPWAP